MKLYKWRITHVEEGRCGHMWMESVGQDLSTYRISLDPEDVLGALENGWICDFGRFGVWEILATGCSCHARFLSYRRSEGSPVSQFVRIFENPWFSWSKAGFSKEPTYFREFPNRFPAKGNLDRVLKQHKPEEKRGR